MMDWQCVEDHPPLREDQVHLWLITLEEHIAQIPNYQKWLSREEQKRVARFQFKKDQQRFIISRAILRKLLAQYCHQRPETITIEQNQYGKPRLPFKTMPNLQFNLSHSKELTLIAITKHDDVGVDIEYQQQDIAFDKLVKRFFSTHEHEEYQALPQDQKRQGFYNAWTRKEAVTKAIGQGIVFPLKQFDVSLSPNKDAQVLAIRRTAPKLCSELNLYGFTPQEHYCAALCWKGSPKTLFFYDFQAS